KDRPGVLGRPALTGPDSLEAPNGDDGDVVELWLLSREAPDRLDEAADGIRGRFSWIGCQGREEALFPKDLLRGVERLGYPIRVEHESLPGRDLDPLVWDLQADLQAGQPRSLRDGQGGVLPGGNKNG